MIKLYSAVLVAQLDRVPDYESGGCEFESCLARHYREIAQLGSALDLGSRGRRFKSCRPDQSGPMLAINGYKSHKIKRFSSERLQTQRIISLPVAN